MPAVRYIHCEGRSTATLINCSHLEFPCETETSEGQYDPLPGIYIIMQVALSFGPRGATNLEYWHSPSLFIDIYEREEEDWFDEGRAEWWFLHGCNERIQGMSCSMECSKHKTIQRWRAQSQVHLLQQGQGFFITSSSMLINYCHSIYCHGLLLLQFCFN